MEFGKLPDISKVDFSLPADALGTAKTLRKYDKSATFRFYIGCTGWSMKEWVGSYYPAGTKPEDFLQAYGKQFNTIELNTTHYRIPTLEIVENWKKNTPSDFRFCPKVPQTLSHSRDLGLSNPQFNAFCSAVEQMEEKLGACFLQLPPHFSCNQLEVLERMLQRWPKHLPLNVEFRHESWFSAPLAEREAAFDRLAEQSIGTVLTDVAGRRDALHQRLTSSIAMIRFVGNALHPTDYTRIEEWVPRLRHWYDLGLQEVYFFTHEPDNLLAPELATYLYKTLSPFPEVAVRGPEKISIDAAGQMSLFG
jgi:uncharacterized protein YecE (DUF72 family)